MSPPNRNHIVYDADITVYIRDIFVLRCGMDTSRKPVLVRLPTHLVTAADEAARRESERRGRQVSRTEIITRALRREVREPAE